MLPTDPCFLVKRTSQFTEWFWLNDNGSQITVKTEWNEAAFNQWGINYDNIKMYPKMQPGYQIGSLAFCEPELVEASDDDCFGSRTIGKYK